MKSSTSLYHVLMYQTIKYTFKTIKFYRMHFVSLLIKKIKKSRYRVLTTEYLHLILGHTRSVCQCHSYARTRHKRVCLHRRTRAWMYRCCDSAVGMFYIRLNKTTQKK